MKKPIKFEVHYHGTPVLVGQRYDPKDLHAHLIYSDKEFKDVRSIDFTVSDNLVTHTGQNSFYATYIWNNKTFIDYFTVYGYTNKRYINKDFKIFYIDDNQENDMTEYYYPLFYNKNLDKIYVTINNLNKHLLKGKYKITVPQDSGMNHRYATEWIVIKDSYNIKITLIKTYNEEEIENA